MKSGFWVNFSFDLKNIFAKVMLASVLLGMQGTVLAEPIMNDQVAVQEFWVKEKNSGTIECWNLPLNRIPEMSIKVDLKCVESTKAYGSGEMLY